MLLKYAIKVYKDSERSLIRSENNGKMVYKHSIESKEKKNTYSFLR